MWKSEKKIHFTRVDWSSTLNTLPERAFDKSINFEQITLRHILEDRNLHSHGRSRSGSWSCSLAVSKPVWHIPLLFVRWKTPDDGQRNCPQHVEFYSKNKFEKLVHLVGFIIRIYHDAWSPERQTEKTFFFCLVRRHTEGKLNYWCFWSRVAVCLLNSWIGTSSSFHCNPSSWCAEAMYMRLNCMKQTGGSNPLSETKRGITFQSTSRETTNS